MMISHSKKSFEWKRGTKTRGKEDHEIYFRGQLFGTVRRSFHKKGYTVITGNIEGLKTSYQHYPSLGQAQEFLENRIAYIELRDSSNAHTERKRMKKQNHKNHIKTYSDANDALDSISTTNPNSNSFLNDIA